MTSPAPSFKIKIANDQEAMLDLLIDKITDAVIRGTAASLRNEAQQVDSAMREIQQLVHQAQVQIHVLVDTRIEEVREAFPAGSPTNTDPASPDGG
jgi:collagenase-like PrtC family protease